MKLQAGSRSLKEDSAQQCNMTSSTLLVSLLLMLLCGAHCLCLGIGPCADLLGNYGMQSLYASGAGLLMMAQSRQLDNGG